MKYQNIEALSTVKSWLNLWTISRSMKTAISSVKFKFADELRKIAEYIEINTTEDTAVAG